MAVFWIGDAVFDRNAVAIRFQGPKKVIDPAASYMNRAISTTIHGPGLAIKGY